MSTGSLKEIASLIDTRFIDVELGQPNFADIRYKSKPFDINNFRLVNSVDTNKKISFIDGGNLEILSAPNFSITLVRIYFNIFKNKLKLKPRNIPNKIEFFSITTTKSENGNIIYETRMVPLNEKFNKYLPDERSLCFNSHDSTISYGKFRAQISTLGSIARRFSEWNYTSHIIENELGGGDIIVRDGTLQTSVTNETKYAEKAYASAEKNNVIFSGLAKTCTLITSTGLPLITAVGKLSERNGFKEKCWYYNPIVDSFHPDHKAEIYVCKLHKNSKHIFRFEIYRKQVELLEDDNVTEIFQTLSNISNDLSFLGYPYGLIDADKFARVSNLELSPLKTVLCSELSKKNSWDSISKSLYTQDAHDILNLI